MSFSLISGRPFSFTLARHADAAKAGEVVPMFRLRYLSSRTFADLLELMKTDAARAFYVVASVGLVGWVNIEQDGELAPFQPAKDGKRLVHGIEVEGGASAASLDALPYEVIVELAQKIIEANQLDRDSVKN